MSIRLIPGAARLTVLGSGWSVNSVESGSGLTENGQLWEDLAGDLGYDYGSDVDWDQIADNDFNWDDLIYTDPDGNVYPGNESNRGEDFTQWIPEDSLAEISESLENAAENDSRLVNFSIPASELKSLYGGKVFQEPGTPTPDSDRPHRYSPAVWYIQQNENTAILFLDEPFYHTDNRGGSIQVYDEAITIRPGSTKSVYWSTCSTKLSPNYLPQKYQSFPIQYICWQCLHGSFSDVLVSATDNVTTTEDILSGNVPLNSMEYNGKTYYQLLDKE